MLNPILYLEERERESEREGRGERERENISARGSIAARAL